MEGRLLVVGPVWAESWLRDLQGLEALDYRFIECSQLTDMSSDRDRDRHSSANMLRVLQLTKQIGFRCQTVQVGASTFAPCDPLSYRP